jgi:hypothetical protein
MFNGLKFAVSGSAPDFKGSVKTLQPRDLLCLSHSLPAQLSLEHSSKVFATARPLYMPLCLSHSLSALPSLDLHRTSKPELTTPHCLPV